MNAKTNAVMATAAITMLLIMGSSIVPMQQSHASGDNKKTGDFKSSIKASAVSDKKSSSQHSDQDNFATGATTPAGKPGTADSGQGQRGSRIQRPEQEPPINTGHSRGSRRHRKQ